jgi:formate dehydrogenase iron-sulfur subunit
MGELVGESVESNEGDAADNTWAILIDTTRCSGCQSCALACKALNQLPNPDEPPTHLASDAYTFIDSRPSAVISREDGESQQGVTYVKRQCMHCLHPACASACTVGALRKTASGPVVYDATKCIGCRYCQYACPFGVPAYAWDEPLGLISKCQMCFNRLNTGQLPACIAACPNGALRLGKRSELLAQAHAQIASNRGRYVDYVYGEHEAGGTAVLYLAAIPFEQLGLPTLDSEAAPEKAEAVMEKTPTVALSVAALATGLFWLTRRRTLHGEHLSSAPDPTPDPTPDEE